MPRRRHTQNQKSETLNARAAAIERILSNDLWFKTWLDRSEEAWHAVQDARPERKLHTFNSHLQDALKWAAAWIDKIFEEYVQIAESEGLAAVDWLDWAENRLKRFVIRHLRETEILSPGLLPPDSECVFR